MNPYYFTFGYGQRTINFKSLLNHYVVIWAYEEGQARKIMFAARGPKFCSCYRTKEEAGIERNGLECLSLDKVMLPLNFHKDPNY